MSGFAVAGFCYSDLTAAAIRIASEVSISGAVVQGSPVLDGSDVLLPVAVVSGGQLVSISPIRVSVLACEFPGHSLEYRPFDPASLESASIAGAYSAGFVAVSIPLVIAMGLSVVLNFIKGERS